jgi:hypothetical protein
VFSFLLVFQTESLYACSLILFDLIMLIIFGERTLVLKLCIIYFSPVFQTQSLYACSLIFFDLIMLIILGERTQVLKLCIIHFSPAHLLFPPSLQLHSSLLHSCTLHSFSYCRTGILDLYVVQAPLAKFDQHLDNMKFNAK